MAIIATHKSAIKLFYSYAHEDEALRDDLAKHLAVLRRQGLISSMHDREIIAGSELDLSVGRFGCSN